MVWLAAGWTSVKWKFPKTFCNSFVCFCHIRVMWGRVKPQESSIDAIMVVICYCEGESSTITQLRLLGFCFSGTSLLGKQGQICFAEFLKKIISFCFAQNFCTDRVDILLCSEANKKGAFSMKFGTFVPSKLVASATSTPTTPTTPSVLSSSTTSLECSC